MAAAALPQKLPAYAPEIHQSGKDNKYRYELTLGGNLNFAEATRRVVYASEHGFPYPLAYVKPAVDWGENLLK
jgi:hypothetical protein